MGELITAMRTGYTYANVHTTPNPAGEIRGQIRKGSRSWGRRGRRPPLGADLPLREEPGPDRALLVLGAFEPADDGQAELGGAGAVDHAVVERERDVAGLRDRELALADDGPLGDPADAEDRDLGVVDDRRLEQAGELAGARDRERRAAELLAA